MTVSVRLDDQLARKLESLAAVEGVSKSELLRRCLEDYLAARRGAASPWELGKDLFGRVGGGGPDLARNSKRIARDRIRARQSRD